MAGTRIVEHSHQVFVEFLWIPLQNKIKVFLCVGRIALSGRFAVYMQPLTSALLFAGIP